MATLVVCKNKNKHWSKVIDVTTNSCIATEKEMLINGNIYLDNLLALFFLLEEELVSKNVL